MGSLIVKYDFPSGVTVPDCGVGLAGHGCGECLSRSICEQQILSQRGQGWFILWPGLVVTGSGVCPLRHAFFPGLYFSSFGLEELSSVSDFGAP